MLRFLSVSGLSRIVEGGSERDCVVVVAVDFSFCEPATSETVNCVLGVVTDSVKVVSILGLVLVLVSPCVDTAALQLVSGLLDELAKLLVSFPEVGYFTVGTTSRHEGCFTPSFKHLTGFLSVQGVRSPRDSPQ